MNWETIIGLEVHIQLKTKSKIFSGASTEFGAEPNSQICAIDIGLPGTLPVLNKEVVTMAIKFGLATHAVINQESIFARKNYFYPDLPKGYQITQHQYPIIGPGHLNIVLEDGSTKHISIVRAHLEEDSGKSLHEDLHGSTGIDLNRCGLPLLEIVSAPDMRNAKEAVAYLKTLHALVCYLDICSGNMQEGAFRCDVNISVRPENEKEFGTRVEVKNINSFKFVERAIDYEIQRQINTVNTGGQIIKETRLFDSTKNETRSMRVKEEESDYRYFSDPDLLPLTVTHEMIQAVQKIMPELPQEKCDRFIKKYNISTYHAYLLTRDKNLATYFEMTVNESHAEPQLAANWIMGELSAALNTSDLTISQSPITAKQLALLLKRIHDGTISGKIAKTVFEAMWLGEGTVDEIIKKKNLRQVTDSSAIEKIIDDVLKNNPEELKNYRAGKEKLFGFFVGEVMRLSQGKANPRQVNELLKKKL